MIDTRPLYEPRLLAVWACRACFVCGLYGPCAHREPDVEYALMEARSRIPYANVGKVVISVGGRPSGDAVAADDYGSAHPDDTRKVVKQ